MSLASEHIFVNIKQGTNDFFICRAIYNKQGAQGESIGVSTYPGSWYLDVNLTNANYQNDNICFYTSSVLGRPTCCVEPETIRPGGYVADAGGTVCTGNFELYFGFDPS